MGNELVDFLRARLDESEAAARGASPGPWWLVQNHFEGDNVVQIRSAATEADSVHGQWTLVARLFATPDTAVTRVRMAGDSVHLLGQDPQHVLADVAAKRAVVDECAAVVDADAAADVTRRERRHATRVLLALVTAYRHHGQFREEWLPVAEEAPAEPAPAAGAAVPGPRSAPLVAGAPLG